MFSRFLTAGLPREVVCWNGGRDDEFDLLLLRLTSLEGRFTPIIRAGLSDEGSRWLVSIRLGRFGTSPGAGAAGAPADELDNARVRDDASVVDGDDVALLIFPHKLRLITCEGLALR